MPFLVRFLSDEIQSCAICTSTLKIRTFYKSTMENGFRTDLSQADVLVKSQIFNINLSTFYILVRYIYERRDNEG